MTARISVPVENALNIYTDGSSFSSPRAGGIGVVYVRVDSIGNEEVINPAYPGFESATNNQMELQACVTALQDVRRRDLADGLGKIVIHTDSMYVQGNVGSAIFEWSRNRWHTRAGTPVANTEQWKTLVGEIKTAKNLGFRVDFKWVKGHSKDPHNRAADKAARRSAKSPLKKPPLNPVSVRRKRTKESVELGSVHMEGQRLTVRVITCEYLRSHGVWKLRYEVLSKASPYHGKVDFIYSDEFMKDGCSYYIRVNKDTANPRVAKIFKRLD